MKPRAISAFTMIELLVVMVLSGILVAIAFLMFQIIHKQQLNYENIGDRTFVIDNFNRLLTYDIQNADLLYAYQQEISCQIDQQTIKYQFENQFVTRSLVASSVAIDTFYITNKDLTCTFKQNSRAIGIIDQCSFLIQFGELWIPINHQKRYSAQQLMSFK